MHLVDLHHKKLLVRPVRAFRSCGEFFLEKISIALTREFFEKVHFTIRRTAIISFYMQMPLCKTEKQ